VVLRASLLGVLIIAITMDVLDADVDLAVKILLLVVFREVGPLAAATVIILRSGTAMSAEMAMMRISGQTRALRYMGIDLYDYLVVPRVAGVMVATVALTFYIQALAVAGGLLFSPFIIEATFMELASRLFDLFRRSTSTTRSSRACCSASRWRRRAATTAQPADLTQNAVPKVVTRAVTQCAMLVLTINAVFAYVVFGILSSAW
jgi:phospholipid/cholesterol/gamma-HCH transport system permease protein